MASAAHLAKSGASWFTNILRFSGVRRLEAIPGYERRIPNWVKPKAMHRRRRVTRPVNDAEERHLQILRMGLRFFRPRHGGRFSVVIPLVARLETPFCPTDTPKAL
jgi:hypothetical protein